MNLDNYSSLVALTLLNNCSLLVVSKNQNIESVKEVFDAGQRAFAENRVQSLLERKTLLPDTIEWHLTGSLQRNKVKLVAPFIKLIHSVDSLILLDEIEKQAIRNNRKIDVLLQVYISHDPTKFGFCIDELRQNISSNAFNKYPNINIKGLMGMATLTDDEQLITADFAFLKSLFDSLSAERFFSTPTPILSMGMSSDYAIAIAQGSNMIRVGSKIFN